MILPTVMVMHHIVDTKTGTGLASLEPCPPLRKLRPPLCQIMSLKPSSKKDNTNHEAHLATINQMLAVPILTTARDLVRPRGLTARLFSPVCSPSTTVGFQQVSFLFVTSRPCPCLINQGLVPKRS